jgi:hypothetical protein
VTALIVNNHSSWRARANCSHHVFAEVQRRE